MNNEIFFSVIIPTFNRKSFLRFAIDSVLAQTYKNFELIIVDDGSTDSTRDLIKSYTDARIVYLYQENKGVSASRNLALSKSKGDFIAFLDSDDNWLKEKLEKTVKYIKKYPKIDIFHTEEIWHKNGKILCQKKKHKKPTDFAYESSLALCCIGMSTAVIKKNVFDKVGVFDETFEGCEDYDFWLRTTYKYEIKLIPENLTVKNGGRPDQLSLSIWGLDRFRIKALKKMLDSKKLNALQYDRTLAEFKKKCEIFSLGSEKHGKIEEAKYYSSLPALYAK